MTTKVINIRLKRKIVRLKSKNDDLIPTFYDILCNNNLINQNYYLKSQNYDIL